jgi:hypothetical protein
VSKLKISIESWQPEYGSPIGENDLSESPVSLDLGVEMKPEVWSAVSNEPGIPGKQTIYFIDGVQRIEARAWLQDDGIEPVQGIFVSIAAGIVKASTKATVEAVNVKRFLFSPLAPDPLVTRAGTFIPRMAKTSEPKDMYSAIQESLRQLESEVAAGLLKDEDSLMIVDGPLSRHDTGIVAIGYVKTHQRSYLPEAQQRTLVGLKTHQRTPIFQIIDGWNRYSWYLRLPGPISHPLSCVVRLEAVGQLDYVIKIANTSSSLLRHYASVPHKDPRAPQNLFPIGGLEKELKHRLGDSSVISRALKLAAKSF